MGMSVGSEFVFRQMIAAGRASIRRTFAAHVPLYACTALFAAPAAALLFSYNLSLPLGSAQFFLTMIAKAALLVAAVTALRHLVRMYRYGRPENPLMLMGQRLLAAALAEDRVGNMVHGLLTFTPLMMIFAALKIDIAHIHPF